MTDTRLSRESEVFRETMREFAEETLKLLADREARFHAEAFEETASMGLLGVIFGEEYNGDVRLMTIGGGTLARYGA